MASYAGMAKYYRQHMDVAMCPGVCFGVFRSLPLGTIGPLGRPICPRSKKRCWTGKYTL